MGESRSAHLFGIILTDGRHLVNNGVRESPPSVAAAAAAFADLRGRNVGFKNWHPTSVRGGGYTALGRGAAGGAWEWTSTVLTPHKGFSEEPAYPEYTGEFCRGIFFL